METAKKSKQAKKRVNTQQKTGRYSSMDELSTAKTGSAKDFIANIDLTLFKKNGHVE